MHNFAKIFVLIFSLSLISGCSLVQWKRDSDESELQRANFTAHTLQLAEGGSVRYWTGGKGKPLLLIHGFGGSATSTWQTPMLELSKDYQVIAPDLAWFGQSYSEGTPNLDTETELIWQLLDHLNIDEVNVAGISYGGFVTFNMMQKPDRIDKAIIIASPGPLFSDEDLADMNRRFGTQVSEDFFVPKNEQELRRLFNGIFYEPKTMPDFIAEQIYEEYFAPWQEQKIQMIQSLPLDRERILDNTNTTRPQTMLIWGEADQVFPLANGIKLSKYLNAPLVVLPETAHGVTNEQGETVARLIKSFVQ